MKDLKRSIGIIEGRVERLWVGGKLEYDGRFKWNVGCEEGNMDVK